MRNDPGEGEHRSILRRIARRVMRERGLLPEFSAAACAELAQMGAPADRLETSIRDLRHLLWCSIDNDDSRDLDQLTAAEALPGDSARIFVAVADVDALVKKDSAVDDHARQNTTSVYTAGEIFPMLPEKLSTDLTSLNFDVDRLAIIVEMTITSEGRLDSSDVYRGMVHNYAKLAYNSVAAWLENRGPVPDAMAKVNGLDANLRLQDTVAQKLSAIRHACGALDLETIEARPVFENGHLTELRPETRNRAKGIIEDFMITANGATARYLSSEMFPSLRRVVRTPKRWDRIVEIAADQGSTLPGEPDPKALEDFLVRAKARDPLRFPDLSLTIIKLLGTGEYIVELPGHSTAGHFGLAVKDYAHSTAPNRRFPDLITQRLLKSALGASPVSYTADELEALARHCTEQEDAARKVERQVEKSAAALMLESRIGQRFDGIVTGASDKGTWVRLLALPIEGKLVSGFEGADVGDRINVELIHTDIERGFIDFRKAR